MVDHWHVKPYSKDLRQKVVQALEHGTSKSWAARLFGISLSSLKRYSRHASQGESLTPGKEVDDPQSRRDHNEAHRRRYTEKPAATISERRRFNESFAARVSANLP
jgi:transposase